MTGAAWSSGKGVEFGESDWLFVMWAKFPEDLDFLFSFLTHFFVFKTGSSLKSGNSRSTLKYFDPG
jgi:hypothetical protein